MEISEFEINNIENILQNRENEDLVFQRLSGFIADSQIKMTTLINKFINKQKNLKNKSKINNETLNQLHHQLKDIDQQSQRSALEQKVLHKKISNNNKAIELLKEEVDYQKDKKEELTLELVDLEADHETARERKVKEYAALKKAVGQFKEKLNIHLGVQALDDHDRVRITFFLSNNPNRDYYFVQFLNYNNIVWKVESIVPELDDDHLRDLNLDFSKDYEVEDIIKMIPKIRRIYVKHYLSP